MSEPKLVYSNTPNQTPDMPAPPFASAKNVTLTRGNATILNNINLCLGEHGCTVILGPNGAGKSLLLKLLHGIIEPDTGLIEWGGVLAPKSTRNQALVFQKPVLLRRTVIGNVRFVLKARKKDTGSASALLERAGLSHKANQPARALSGGEAQRLALACALASEPKVLLLDEPTANLDPTSVRAIEDIVGDARKNGLRVLLVTHDVGQARRMADDVVFLNKGEVVEHAPAETFFPTPRSRVAQAFLSGELTT